MYKGKNKCRILKQIRAEIARNNGIDYVVEECRYKGDCTGTCPKCEAEVRMLEEKLAERASLGKRVLLTGIAAGIVLTASACGPDVHPTAGTPEPPTATVRSTPSTASGEQTTDPNALQGEVVLPASEVENRPTPGEADMPVTMGYMEDEENPDGQAEQATTEDTTPQPPVDQDPEPPLMGVPVLEEPEVP